MFIGLRKESSWPEARAEAGDTCGRKTLTFRQSLEITSAAGAEHASGRLRSWIASDTIAWRPAYLASAASMAVIRAGSSGDTRVLKRPSTVPSRPIRNFSKFQPMSPGGFADAVSVL